jgi:hypothetical protein
VNFDTTYQLVVRRMRKKWIKNAKRRERYGKYFDENPDARNH